MVLLDNIQKQVKNKILSNVVEGVERFPVLAYQAQEKKFLIVSDFPDKEEPLFIGSMSSNPNNSGIIVKLLEKLGIYGQSYFTYAFQEVSESNQPLTHFSYQIHSGLLEFISHIKPDAILCFGHRSLLSLSALHTEAIPLPLDENLELQNFLYGKDSCRLFYLSSIKDLRVFPLWRRQVWQVLLPFSKVSAAISS